jgi:putative ABC transport system permease protein
MIRLLRQVSVRQFRASWGRTALIVAGIATGVALIVAINVVNSSVLSGFRNTIELVAGPSDLEITLGVGEVGFPEDTVDAVRGDPGVATAVALVRGTVSLAKHPDSRVKHAEPETLLLFGADLMAEQDLQRYQVTSMVDREEILNLVVDPSSILVTSRLALKSGLAVGNDVELVTPEGIREVTVRGLLEPYGLAAAYGGQLAVMDLPAAQLMLGKEGRIDQIDVVLRKGDEDKETVIRRLEAVLPSGIKIGSPDQRIIEYEDIVASFQAMLAGISTICLVAGIFIVYNTTSTGAIQRAQSMARLRVIGAPANHLFRLLLLEALVLGAVGTALGLVCGFVLAWFLSGMVTESMGIIFQLRFPVDRLRPDLRQLASVAAVGMGAALFASYFAARRVAALEPLDVLDGRERVVGAQPSSRTLVKWWLLLVGVSAAALAAQEQLKSAAWGNFGATLWNASVIVIAVPMVAWSSGLLSRWLLRLFAAEGRIAAESLLRSPTRTGLTVAAISLVVTLGIILSSLTLSFRNSMNDYLGRFLAADLTVSAVATEGGWLETPIPESLADEIGEIQGVQGVDVLRVLPGQMYAGLRISIGGLTEGLFDATRYPRGWYREGDAGSAVEELKAGRGVNISTGLSDRMDLHKGDIIELDTPTGPLALPIVGVVTDYASDRGSVIVNRRLVVERWQDRAVNRILVRVAPGSVDSVRARIAERFAGRYLLKILSLREILSYHDEMIGRAFAFTKAIQLLVIIVTIAGILDLLVSAIVERRRELGLWRVIGADERSVRRSVIIESATIGGLGVTLGVAVGMVTAWIWIQFNFRHLLGYYLEQHFAVLSTLWYVVLVMAMTVVAGYAAARQATRQDVIDAIQIE